MQKEDSWFRIALGTIFSFGQVQIEESWFRICARNDFSFNQVEKEESWFRFRIALEVISLLVRYEKRNQGLGLH